MIVLDASAAIEMTRETEHGKRYEELMYTGEKVISVDLMHAEVAYVFSKYVRAGEYSPVRAQKLAHHAVSLVDEYVGLSELMTEAFNEGVRLGHSTYDMFYFVLARRTGSTLFTRDNRLARLCIENGVSCVRELATDAEEWTTRVSEKGYDPAS